MKIHEIDTNLYSIYDAIDTTTMGLLLDEFDCGYNGINLSKREIIGDVGNSGPRPRWLCLLKPEGEEQYSDTLGDVQQFIRVADNLSILVRKILKRNVELKRINTNIQFPTQDATFHLDGGADRWTLLLFLSRNWNTNWGGEFICQVGDTYHGIPFIPTRGVLFNASYWHRGSAPNIMADEIRRSIAFTYQEV